MPNEFRKEVERTYLLPSTYSVPNTPHVHIRQSHLFDATSITELIEGVALNVHKALTRMNLTNDDLDKYIILLISLSEHISETFADTDNYAGYKLRVRITNRKEAELTVKWKLKHSTQDTKIYDELNISIPREYAGFLLTEVWIASEWIQKLWRDLRWITKMRHKVRWIDGKNWDVDNYLWANRGIKTADIELTSEEEQALLLHNAMKHLFWETAKPYDTRRLQIHPFWEWSDRELIEHQNLSFKNPQDGYLQN